MNCFDKFVYFSEIYRNEWIPVNGTRNGVSRYAIPIGILYVDGLSTGPLGFEASQLRIKAKVYESLSSRGWV